MAPHRGLALALALLPALAGCLAGDGDGPGRDALGAAFRPAFGADAGACEGEARAPPPLAVPAQADGPGLRLDVPAPATGEAPAAPGLSVPAGLPVAVGAGAAAPTEAVLKTDAYGVTHIYADDPYTLFYANGYVQARDRLFQLHVLRHVGYGDSASVAGAGQLASDIAVRRDLYSRDEIAAQFDRAPPGVRLGLQAYADGVNRFLAEAVANDALPVEFAAVGPPEPWVPEDSVAAIDYLIGYFGSGGGEELSNARRYAALEDALGRDAAFAALADLHWLRAEGTYTSIPAKDLAVDGCESVPRLADVPAEQLDLALAAAGSVPWGVPAELVPTAVALGQRQGAGLFEGFKWGSNALLIAGEHTATGEAMMFGGPQMGYYKPPVPYQVGLHGAGYDAVGIGVASAPGIVIGRTPTFAWSVTSGADDQVDTVALRLSPGDDRVAVVDGRDVAMDCRTELHRALPTAAAPTAAPQVVAQEVCRVDGMPVVAWNPEAGVAWAQRSTTRGEELDGAWLWLNVATCRDLACFLGQLEDFPFTFNFHYAGPEGIAYVHTGDVPLRDPGLDPRLPALAGSAHAWRGEAVGLDLGTWVVNPSTGYVANWNNAPAHGWRTGDTLQLWGSAHRVQLLDRVVRERLAEDEPVAWQDVSDLLEAAATHDPFAPHVVPDLVRVARQDAATRPLAAMLQEWADAGYPWADGNGDGRYDHNGHIVYDAVRARLQEVVFADELGAGALALEFDPRLAGDPHAGDHGRHDNRESTLVDALAGRTAHDWCDDAATEARESCDDAIRTALQAGAVYGIDMPAADFMLVHRSRFTPIGGAHADEIPMVNRGSWNQVVAIGQGLDQAQGVLPPGNSGLVTGPELALAAAGLVPEPARVTAELGLYTSFGYKPLPVTSDEVDSVTVAEQTLLVPDRLA